MRQIRNSDTVYLKRDNTKSHWIIEALEFYKENNMKVIEWLSYSPDLNLIKNVWTIIKKRFNFEKNYNYSKLENKLFKI